MMPVSIDRDQVRHLVAEDAAQLVEVLPRPEYDWGHLAGAISLPLKQMSAERAAETLDRSRPVIVYCNDFQ